MFYLISSMSLSICFIDLGIPQTPARGEVYQIAIGRYCPQTRQGGTRMQPPALCGIHVCRVITASPTSVAVTDN
jgi:hypothetical protein